MKVAARCYLAIVAGSLGLVSVGCAVPWYPEPPPYVPYEPSVIDTKPHLRTEAVAWTPAGLGPHGGSVRIVAFSPDGQRLVTAERDKPALVWSVQEQRLQRSLPHEDAVRGLAFVPTSDAVVVAGEQGLWRWQLDTGEQQLVAAQAQLNASALALSGDGSRAITGTAHGHLLVWDLAAGQRQIELREVHQGYVNAVAFNARRPLLASGGQDGVARVWNAADGSPISIVDTRRDQVRDVAFSPDGSRLALAVGDLNAPAVWIWSAESRTIERELSTSYAWPDALSWAPDGEHLAVARGDAMEIWDTAGAGARPRYSGSKRDVVAVNWCQTGSAIAYGSDDGWVRLVPWGKP